MSEKEKEQKKEGRDAHHEDISKRKGVDSLHIVLVDDDPFLREMYSHKWGSEGHTVVTCGTITEAGRVLKESEAPDIVALDVIMAGIGLDAFLSELVTRGLFAKTALVLLTNQDDPDEIERLTATYHLDDYIIKADTLPSVVLKKLVKAVDKKRKSIT